MHRNTLTPITLYFADFECYCRFLMPWLYYAQNNTSLYATPKDTSTILYYRYNHNFAPLAKATGTMFTTIRYQHCHQETNLKPFATGNAYKGLTIVPLRCSFTTVTYPRVFYRIQYNQGKDNTVTHNPFHCNPLSH